jgi:PEP-CTERM motif
LYDGAGTTVDGTGSFTWNGTSFTASDFSWDGIDFPGYVMLPALNGVSCFNHFGGTCRSGTSGAFAFLTTPSCQVSSTSGWNAGSYPASNDAILVFNSIGGAQLSDNENGSISPIINTLAQNGHFTVTDTTLAVPEPEAYAMMLAGLGLASVAARRTKQA